MEGQLPVALETLGNGLVSVGFFYGNEVIMKMLIKCKSLGPTSYTLDCNVVTSLDTI